MDNNVNNSFSRYGRLVIYTAGIIAYGFLLWMCYSQMRQFGDVETRLIPKEVIPKMMYITLPSSTDSLAKMSSEIARFNTKMDSAVKLINTWNDSCYERDRLLNGLNDLRQETNNVIDKQNGWLSFWIAILALVGALLPLLIQMNMQQEQRHKFEEEKKNIQSVLNETKDFKTTMQNELKETSNSLKSEIKKELEPLKSNRYYSEISKLSFTLIECSESFLRIDDSERNKYCNDLLFKLHKMTDSFFAMIAENDNVKRSDKINDLKIVLIQLLAAYNACKVLITQKPHLKNFETVTTSIGEILQKLYADNIIDNQKLTELLGQMEPIHIA